jgi:hypothetical protein
VHTGAEAGSAEAAALDATLHDAFADAATASAVLQAPVVHAPQVNRLVELSVVEAPSPPRMFGRLAGGLTTEALIGIAVAGTTAFACLVISIITCYCHRAAKARGAAPPTAAARPGMSTVRVDVQATTTTGPASRSTGPSKAGALRVDHL